MKKIIYTLLMFMAMATATAQKPAELPAGPVVDIKTSVGDIKVKLYDDTPRHRDNFLKLVKDGYYNGVLFHRVIKDFMVQTGDPGSVNADSTAMLGIGGPDYQIDAEILAHGQSETLSQIRGVGCRTHRRRHESRAQEQRLTVLYSDRTQI